MKLPIPFFLYLTSLGLLGAAGWVFYKAWPQVNVGTEWSTTGQRAAIDALARSKGADPTSRDWNYSRQPQWWQTLKSVNLTGREPPKQTGPTTPVIEQPVAAVSVQPLEEIIELVSLMYDPEKGGQGGQTHVTLKYKPTANVQPPEWYMREMQAANNPGSGFRPPMDVAAQAQPARPGPGNRPQPKPGPATPMPTSAVGREYLQRVFVEGDGSERQGRKLWPPFEHIRLVRVSSDAQVAYFVRDLPTPPAKEGETPPAPVQPAEERLRKSMLGLSQDLLEVIDKLQGGNRAAEARNAPASGTVDSQWVDNPDGETRQVGNRWHIGRNDEQMIRENPERLFESFHAETYVSRVGSTRGVQIRSVTPEMSRRYGVVAGDVIVAVNGEAVSTKADAIAVGKRQYNRGARTFTVKFLTAGGQFVERVYTAPDRKN